MNELYFQISDFIIEPDKPISLDVINKILVHLWIINDVRIDLGHYILVSKNSGYRSVSYEKSKKRTGFSEHCFLGGGASDYTCQKKYIKKLVELLRKSDYKRVCYYPKSNFVHCDLKGHEKQFFICEGKKWKRQ
jgi:uncharacterized protein YcbK (DUF882 family)